MRVIHDKLLQRDIWFCGWVFLQEIHGIDSTQEIDDQPGYLDTGNR
jgi:hypothetical protein